MITVQTYVLVVVPAIVVATCLAAVLWSRRAARLYDASVGPSEHVANGTGHTS